MKRFAAPLGFFLLIFFFAQHFASLRLFDDGRRLFSSPFSVSSPSAGRHWLALEQHTFPTPLQRKAGDPRQDSPHISPLFPQASTQMRRPFVLTYTSSSFGLRQQQQQQQLRRYAYSFLPCPTSSSADTTTTTVAYIGSRAYPANGPALVSSSLPNFGSFRTASAANSRPVPWNHRHCYFSLKHAAFLPPTPTLLHLSLRRLLASKPINTCSRSALNPAGFLPLIRRRNASVLHSSPPQPEMIEGISRTETANRNLAPVPPAMVPTQPLYAQFKVGNLTRSVTFYEQVLGMKVLHYQDMPSLNRSRVFMGYESGVSGFPSSEAAFMSLIQERDRTEIKRGLHSYLGIGVNLPNISHVNIKGLAKVFGGRLHDRAQPRRITPSMIPDEYARDIVNWTNSFVFDPDGYGIELVKYRNATTTLKHVPWQHSSAYELAADAVLQRAKYPPPPPSQRPDWGGISKFLREGGVNTTLSWYGTGDSDGAWVDTKMKEEDEDAEADDLGASATDSDADQDTAIETNMSPEERRKAIDDEEELKMQVNRMLSAQLAGRNDTQSQHAESGRAETEGIEGLQEPQASETMHLNDSAAPAPLNVKPFNGPQYLHRFRLFTSNLKKATSFYEDALGMRTVRYRSHLKEYTYPWNIYPAQSRYFGYGGNYNIFDEAYRPSVTERNATEVFQPLLQVTYAYDEDKILRGDDYEYMCMYSPNVRAAIKHIQSTGRNVYPVQILRFRKRNSADFEEQSSELPPLESVTFRILDDAKPLHNISDSAFTMVNGALQRLPPPPRWVPPSVSTCFGRMTPDPESDYDSNSDEEACRQSISGYRSGMDKHIEDQVLEAGGPGSPKNKQADFSEVVAASVGGSIEEGNAKHEGNLDPEKQDGGSSSPHTSEESDLPLEQDDPGVIAAVAVFDTNRYATILTNLKPSFRKIALQ